ncbi:MAG: hypothetical protein IPL26_11185 [Leptospiraceae bacterium]|nr:hypothetical protein [Leptospiraceae bacterium]
MVTKKNFRTCRKGHQYFKTNEMLTCPVCEKDRKQKEGFHSLISAPARKALEHNGINSLIKLSQFSKQEISQFDGMGQTSISKLISLLQIEGLSFKKDEKDI